MPELALPLLVTGVLTDHEDRAAAADDLAFLAHGFYGRSNLHRPQIRIEIGLPAVPGVGPRAQIIGLEADEEG
jgi:hypothetical protein